jgi:hypothetical protein
VSEGEEMKMVLPSIITCRRIYKLLSMYYADESNRTPFDHAMIILSGFYNIKKPTVRFRRSFGKQKCIGLCSDKGFIEILYPSAYGGNVQAWIAIVYHEFGHYYFYSNAEDKANEFEKRMLARR